MPFKKVLRWVEYLILLTLTGLFSYKLGVLLEFLYVLGCVWFLVFCWYMVRIFFWINRRLEGKSITWEECSLIRKEESHLKGFIFIFSPVCLFMSLVLTVHILLSKSLQKKRGENNEKSFPKNS